MDYIFIFLNFIYILFLLLISYSYFNKTYNSYQNTINVLLTSFNNIKINEYKLPNDFQELEKKERRKFILNNYTKIECKYSTKQYDLIKKINKLREDNNIEQFKIGKKLPELVVRESSEIILNKEEHIFQLSNNRILLKYPVGEFENKFNGKDINIINILLNKNLNHIQMIIKDNIEYIIFSELALFDYDSYDLDSLKMSIEVSNYKFKKKHYKLIDYEYKNYNE